jgi:hypothetical protein
MGDQTNIIAALADAFVANLRGRMSPAEYEWRKRRNKFDIWYANDCAFSDYADEELQRAFRSVMGREPDAGSELDAEFCASARRLARSLYLGTSMHKRGTPQ